MKLNSKKTTLVITLILFSFLAINFCQAAFIKEDVKDKINLQGKGAGLGAYEDIGPEGVLKVIQTAINAFLSLIGVILLIYMLYAGYNWMTAQGEEEKVEKAKDTLKRAIVGALIIVAAYAISVFVIARIEAGNLKAAGSANTSTSGESGNQTASCPSGMTQTTDPFGTYCVGKSR